MHAYRTLISFIMTTIITAFHNNTTIIIMQDPMPRPVRPRIPRKLIQEDIGVKEDWVLFHLLAHAKARNCCLNGNHQCQRPLIWGGGVLQDSLLIVSIEKSSRTSITVMSVPDCSSISGSCCTTAHSDDGLCEQPRRSPRCLP